MKTGITPVVVTVILVAMAVIATSTLWYWSSPLASQQKTPGTSIKTFTVVSAFKNSTNNGCNAISVKNTGTETIRNAGFFLKDPDTGRPVGENGTDPTYPAFVNLTEVLPGSINIFSIYGYGKPTAKTYDSGSSYDYARGVVVDNNNNIIVAGYVNNANLYMIKYDSSGNQLWAVTAPNIRVYDVAVDSQNNIYVAGEFPLSVSSLAFIAKYDSSGNHLWNRTANCSTALYTWYEGVAIDSNGSVIATGWCQANGGYTIKYNSSGSHMWNKTHYESKEMREIAVDSSDNIYVAGTYGAINAYYVIKYNSGGTHVWNRTLAVSPYNDYGWGVSLDNSGNVLLTGQSNVGTITTVKLNSSGSHMWNKSVYDSWTNYGFGVSADSNNNVVVCGVLNSKFYVIKYDSNGNHLWNKSFAGSAYSVDVDSDNNIVVSGYVNGDYYLVKYTSDGNSAGASTSSVPLGNYLLRSTSAGIIDQEMVCI